MKPSACWRRRRPTSCARFAPASRRSESETEAVLLDALRQDPAKFRTDAALRRWIGSNRPESSVGLADLADSLDHVVTSARRIHAG